MGNKFKEIISIHGVPRSGTSWLGQIIDSSPEVRYKYQPLFSYTFKDQINLQSSKEEIINYFNELYDYEDDFLDQEYKKKKNIYPRFTQKKSNPKVLATKMVRYHFLIPLFIEKLDFIKFVFIVRNPCSVLNSWKNVPREFYEEWNFQEEWRFAQSMNEFRPEQYFGFHKWQEATKLFLETVNNFPDKAMIVQYEDLSKNTMNIANEIYEFINLDFSSQTNEFITKSLTEHQDDPSSVYKANKNLDKWITQLDQNLIDTIYNELSNTEFEKFLK